MKNNNKKVSFNPETFLSEGVLIENYIIDQILLNMCEKICYCSFSCLFFCIKCELCNRLNIRREKMRGVAGRYPLLKIPHPFFKNDYNTWIYQKLTIRRRLWRFITDDKINKCISGPKNETTVFSCFFFIRSIWVHNSSQHYRIVSKNLNDLFTKIHFFYL